MHLCAASSSLYIPMQQQKHLVQCFQWCCCRDGSALCWVSIFLGHFRNVLITIVTFIFQNFSGSLVRSGNLSTFHFRLRFKERAKSSITFFSYLQIQDPWFWPRWADNFKSWNPKCFFVSFSEVDSVSMYFLLAGQNLVAFPPSRASLVMYSFGDTLLHSVIMLFTNASLFQHGLYLIFAFFYIYINS